MESNFLVTTTYRGLNHSVIWEVSVEGGKLTLNEAAVMHLEDNPLLPNKYDCSAYGLAKHEQGYIVSESNGVKIVNHDFKVIRKIQEVDRLRAVHDVKFKDGKIYLTNTCADRVEIYDDQLNHLESIFIPDLPGLNHLKLISKKNPTTISDSIHINFIHFHEDEIYISLSFINKKYGRLKLFKRYPFLRILPFQSPGGIYNLTKKEFFKRDLWGLHDGIWRDDQVWVHQTHRMSLDVYNLEGELVQQKKYKDGGIYRGLDLSGNYALAGMTKVDFSRNMATNVYGKLMDEREGQILENSQLLLLDTESLDILDSVVLPDFQGISPEVSQILAI